MQHKTTQRTTEHTPEHKPQHRPDTEQHTEQNKIRTEQHRTTSTENSAHNYRTYSFDLYHEYAVINNSNTIELYTILQDKI